MRGTYVALLLMIASAISAQDETPELVTDRPDQTESSVTVPLKTLQIETGFVRESQDKTLFHQKSFAWNTTLFRYGLRENFELRLGLEYLGDVTKFHLTDNVVKTSGLSPLYAGFKVKVSEEEGWKPEVAFLGGLIFPSVAHANYKPDYTAADFRFAFSHTLSDRFSIGYNLGAAWDGETAIPAYFYSFVFGTGVTDKIGYFIESYGNVPEEGGAEHLMDTGFTFLLAPNFQLDLSGGIGLKNSIDNFISFGLTYRLPN